MARMQSGGREDRAGGAGKVTAQNWIQKLPALWVWGSGEGVTWERKVREHLRRKVSPLLRFQAPEQAASSEAA